MAPVEERHAFKIDELLASRPPTPGGGSSSSAGIPLPILYLDSGATRHMVGGRRFLCNLRDLPDTKNIMLADGSRSLTASQMGDIYTEDIKIQDVYLVPGPKMDVVSVRQLAKSNIIITFRENDAELCKGSERVGGAIAVGELYQVRFLTATGDDESPYALQAATRGCDPFAIFSPAFKRPNIEDGEDANLRSELEFGIYPDLEKSLMLLEAFALDCVLKLPMDIEMENYKELMHKYYKGVKGKHSEDSSVMCGDKWYYTVEDLLPLTDQLVSSVETEGPHELGFQKVGTE